MAAGLCIKCGKPKGKERIELKLCELCALKTSDTNKVRKIETKHYGFRWVEFDGFYFPSNSENEIIVTDKEGEVYGYEKRPRDKWENLCDDFIAWRYFPEAYKRKETR